MDTPYAEPGAHLKPPSARAVARPLSPLLYLLRNPGKTAPIALIILLAVGLVAGIVALLDSVGVTVKTIYGYNRYFAAVVPRGASELDPALRMRIMEAPDLGGMIECRACVMMVKTIVGKLPFAVFGLHEGDMQRMAARVNLTMGPGRWPREGAPEIALSEPIVRNLKLRVGDVVLSPDEADSYAPVPVRLVGILKGTEWFAVAPYDFVQQNYFLSVDNLFLLSRDPARQPVLDRWLEGALKNTHSRLWVYTEVEKETEDAFKTLYFIVNISIGILVLVIAIMMGLLANIYFTQRMIEFGLLQAIGYTRMSILWRVTIETAIVIVVGWALGVLTAYVGLRFAEVYLTNPRGLVLDPLSARAYRSTVPIPVCITVFAFLTILWRLRKFDPVAIVERRLV